MRSRFQLLASLLLALVLAGAGPRPSLAQVGFDELLTEAGLSLKTSTKLEEIDAPGNPLIRFEKAFRHRAAALQVWYAVRPLARVQIKYNDPHSSAPNPDHIFPMVFQSMVGRLAKHGHTPTRAYPPAKARALFNADWAAATLFDTDAALGSPYRQGLLLALHKNGRGDAYALFLFDDGREVKPAIDDLLGHLSFESEQP